MKWAGAGLEANVLVKRSKAARKFVAGHDLGAKAPTDRSEQTQTGSSEGRRRGRSKWPYNRSQGQESAESEQKV